VAALHRARPPARAVHARGLPQHRERATPTGVRQGHAAREGHDGAIDKWREELLDEGRLSRRSIQKTLVLLHGVLKRAKRRKWITTNPAETWSA